MGCSVLAYQFIAGLRPTLKSKLAGIESTFDPLSAKARFEEALLQDLPAVVGTAPKSPLKDTPRKPYRTPTKLTNQHAVVASSDQECLQGKAGNQCYHCHGTGDYQRSCLCKVVLCQQCLRNGTLELDRKRTSRRVVALVATEETEPNVDHQRKQERVAELHRTLHEAEVEESLSEAETMMRVLNTTSREEGSDRGPTLSVSVEFQGSPVNALLDTDHRSVSCSCSFPFRPWQSKDQGISTPQNGNVKSRLHPLTLPKKVSTTWRFLVAKTLR